MENKKYEVGCLDCPKTENILALDTVLYQGFGGYHVTKDDEIYYFGDSSDDFDSFKSLKDIEKEIPDDSKSRWQVILNNPLRGATWTRKERNVWELIETNLGFA